MNGTKPFLIKDDQALPDSYKITVHYVTGKRDEFELAQHSLNQATNMLEFWTIDDQVNWIPMNSVVRVEFNKEFSKMIAIKSKLDAQKKAEKEAKNNGDVLHEALHPAV